MTDTAGLRDPGLQPERTALAWSRSGLAVLVNAILVLRSGLEHESRLVTALGVALLLSAAVVTVYGTYRKRQLMRDEATFALPRPVLLTMTVVAMLACLAALPVIWMVWSAGL